MKEKIYNMKLHEVFRPECDVYLEILRVPGGWIYNQHQPYSRQDQPGGADYQLTSTFIRFNNEFQDV